METVFKHWKENLKLGDIAGQIDCDVCFCNDNCEGVDSCTDYMIETGNKEFVPTKSIQVKVPVAKSDNIFKASHNYEVNLHLEKDTNILYAEVSLDGGSYNTYWCKCSNVFTIVREEE